jgi:hypothetical protein
MRKLSALQKIYNAVKPVKRKSATLSIKPVDRVKMEMSNLGSAVEAALDPENSDRVELITMYENSWKDSRVISEREKAAAYLVTEPFQIISTNSPNEDKKKLFARPWFVDFMKIALFAEFWGYTLAEFQEQDENGEFTAVKVFPRRHVRPFEKLIVMEPTFREGVSYAETATDFFLIELGEPTDLGKLETITREVIWKTFARSDWSEYNERFGKPILDFATDTTDQNELEKKKEAARDFGSNLWLIRDIEDEVDIVHVASRASSENFRDMATFCDEQIALLFNGQTATSDQKSFVGAAEVQERVLDTFTKARLLNLQNTINYTLIPFLIEHGYPLDAGDRFLFDALDNESKKKMQTPGAPPKPGKPGDPNDPEPDNTAPIGFFA